MLSTLIFKGLDLLCNKDTCTFCSELCMRVKFCASSTRGYDESVFISNGACFNKHCYSSGVCEIPNCTTKSITINTANLIGGY